MASDTDEDLELSELSDWDDEETDEDAEFFVREETEPWTTAGFPNVSRIISTTAMNEQQVVKQPALNRFSLKSHGGSGVNSIDTALWSTQAQFDPKRGLYVMPMELTSFQPFSVSKTAISRDEYGQKREYGSLFFKSSVFQTFRFLDLPAEIRITIYEMVLCPIPNQDVATGNSKDMKAKNAGIDESEVRKSSEEDAIYHPELHFSMISWKLYMKHPFKDGRINLLLVSKQINPEASAVLYGTSIFRFADSNIMKTFLQNIGSNRRYLQRVRLYGGVAPASTLLASRLLAEASRLQWLEIKFDEASIVKSIHASMSLFESLCPLYKMFFARDLDLQMVMTHRITVSFGDCKCTEMQCIHGTHYMHTCVTCKFEDAIDELEELRWVQGYRYYEKHWGKRIREEKMAAEAEAKRAKKQQTNSKKSPKASKKRKRSSRYYGDNDEQDDTLDRSTMSLPAPKSSRKMPGRRAKSMATYEIDSDSGGEMVEDDEEL